MEYPKSLYKGTVEDHLIVEDFDQESKAREEGYEMYAEIYAREQGEQVDTPTKKAKK